MRSITCWLNIRTYSLVTLLCIVIIAVPKSYAQEKATVNNVYEMFKILDDDNGANQEFTQQKIVKPIIYTKNDESDITWKINNLFHHPDHLTIFLSTDDEELILDLTLNTQLISKDYFSKTQKDEVYKINTPSRRISKSCHYVGKVRYKTNSWVALSTCDGLSGTINDGVNTHFLEKINGENGEHVLYKHRDLVAKNTTCGHNFHNKQDSRSKRGLPEGKHPIREPYNSDSESRYVELILVVANRKYVELNSSVENTEQYSKNIANIMNGIYSPLNVFITLVGVVIWTERDEIELSEDGETTLSNFLRYRRTKLVQQHPHDNAQLITQNLFNGGVVGKALKGPICTYLYSGGVTGTQSAVVGVVATSVAHMLGHNFGMEHDAEDCDCPDDICIMNKANSVAPTHWSSCSRKALQNAFDRGMDHCLKNVPKSLYQSPVCGNGFVEGEEECDCGLPEHCNNKCCNAATCKLEGDAKCATGKCCDLKSCSLRKAGVACRSAISECDLSEYCTGSSEHCPADVFRLDGEVCDDSKSHCYQGHCGSNLQQCKLLWGPTSIPSEDVCHKLNVKGSRHGNCGYDKINERYVKCEESDVLCGILFCSNVSDTLQYGLESVSILSNIFIKNKGQIIHCKAAIIDLGTDASDPGMTPNGAPCGEKKMCLNQKCVSVTSIQEGLTCPNNCNNHGYCNSLGQCHCHDGYLLPDCRFLVPGSSVDIGPASNDTDTSREL